MGFDIGAMAGNRASWFGGATAVHPVTDLTAHVDGGQDSSRLTNAVNADSSSLYDAVAVVALALILLWVMGALSFRNHNL